MIDKYRISFSLSWGRKKERDTKISYPSKNCHRLYKGWRAAKVGQDPLNGKEG